ncbi:hypothetical protein BC629DRAFT_369065 [Irpex lacteus]|nr:hypothetical protein BC629DRAFT_369065 [Irpex lacteus]
MSEAGDGRYRADLGSSEADNDGLPRSPIIGPCLSPSSQVDPQHLTHSLRFRIASAVSAHIPVSVKHHRQLMATGADIPPELIQRILFDVCEDADKLLDLGTTVPNRKEAIKNITACSLTCVYWAHICRWQLFCIVCIKSYEDMRAFLALVVNTPTKFLPISQHMSSATLVQRVGDRPWLHLKRPGSLSLPLCIAFPGYKLLSPGLQGTLGAGVHKHYKSFHQLSELSWTPASLFAKDTETRSFNSAIALRNAHSLVSHPRASQHSSAIYAAS